MKVQNLDLRFDMDKYVRIIRIYNSDFRHFEGQTGRLTNPFGEFKISDVGVFLDETKFNLDTINLEKEDEIEFIDYDDTFPKENNSLENEEGQ